MEERIKSLESQVRELTLAVRALEERLGAETSTAAPAPVLAPEVGAASSELSAPLPIPGAAVFGNIVPLVGRTLLVIAGAFLIRAITDRDLVPRAVGVALGLSYATMWIGLAWRAARTHALSATAHGVSAGLIGFPLIVETSTRLAVLSPSVAAAVLTAFTGLLWLTGFRFRMSRFVWLGAAGGLLTVSPLIYQFESALGFLAFLVAFAAGTLWLAEARGWEGVRWPVALFVDFVVLRRVFVSAAHEELHGQAWVAMGFFVALVVLYMAVGFLRTWVRRRPIGFFEILQGLILVAGMTAAVVRTRQILGWDAALGAGALGLAALAMTTALKQCLASERWVDRWYYGVLGLVLVLCGGSLVTSGLMLTLLWASLGFGAALLGRTTLTPMLWSFAAALSWAAATGEGALSLMRDGLRADPSAGWKVEFLHLALVGLVIVATELATSVKAPAVPAWARVFPAALLALTMLTAVSAVAFALRSVLGGSSADRAVLNLVATLALLFAVLVMGALRRLSAPPEFAWVASGAMVLTGLKLLVQDLPAGKPLTLFIAFLALGATIIVFPRLVRTSKSN